MFSAGLIPVHLETFGNISLGLEVPLLFRTMNVFLLSVGDNDQDIITHAC